VRAVSYGAQGIQDEVVGTGSVVGVAAFVGVGVLEVWLWHPPALALQYLQHTTKSAKPNTLKKMTMVMTMKHCTALIHTRNLNQLVVRKQGNSC
jgi:tRNA(Arg) A34 adenosine deaminase TadA